jgi:hypothetical protein
MGAQYLLIDGDNQPTLAGDYGGIIADQPVIPSC